MSSNVKKCYRFQNIFTISNNNFMDFKLIFHVRIKNSYRQHVRTSTLFLIGCAAYMSPMFDWSVGYCCAPNSVRSRVRFLVSARVFPILYFFNYAIHCTNWAGPGQTPSVRLLDSLPQRAAYRSSPD